MYEADLVIASPGLSAFEALCVGTPIIIIPQNSLQREIYKAHIAMLEKSDIARLGHMIENGDFVDPRDARIADLDIGQGISELVEAIIDSR
jgi:spore coat polysaccharide biosynthesis predicted glycosyltransferase SpsG